MLPCTGWLEGNGRNPRSAADLRWFSSPCGTGPPTVVGLPETVLEKRGRRRSIRDSVAEGQPGIGRRRTGGGHPGRPVTGTGPNPAAGPGVVHRLSRRRPPGVGRCRASVAGR